MLSVSAVPLIQVIRSCLIGHGKLEHFAVMPYSPHELHAHWSTPSVEPGRQIDDG